ncbi:hypothetical protein [Desulfitobacterium sp. LBE]|uniref:hypothetical protein n=1 Tax=Desulfitobacterium sp. LBE TaxID=884086 RepID=UPI0032B76AD2
MLSGAGAPDGAKGLSVSFVRAAYGATGVKQNPGEPPFQISFNLKYADRAREIPSPFLHYIELGNSS